jgi:hypothetical protein
MRAFLRVLVLAFGVAAASGAYAQDGSLTITDGSQTVTLTAEQIAALPQTTIETSTAWTEGKHKFSGPTFADVFNAAGLAGETVTIEASDGYAIELPRGTLVDDGAILTTAMDDQPLPADKAPYWVIFNYDQSPEMNDQNHRDWSIWAISKISLS